MWERNIFQTNIVKKNETNISLSGCNNAVATAVLAPGPCRERVESSSQSRTMYWRFRVSGCNSAMATVVPDNLYIDDRHLAHASYETLRWRGFSIIRSSEALRCIFPVNELGTLHLPRMPTKVRVVFFFPQLWVVRFLMRGIYIDCDNTGWRRHAFLHSLYFYNSRIVVEIVVFYPIRIH
jgi:hypothetical protein